MSEKIKGRRSIDTTILRLQVIENLMRTKNHPNSDNEIKHANADMYLCNFLRDLGYDDVVDVYEQIEKWYA